MSTAEILEQLRHLTNTERLVVIETSTRLISEELQSAASEDDPILRVAGCLPGDPPRSSELDAELYGAGRREGN